MWPVFTHFFQFTHYRDIFSKVPMRRTIDNESKERKKEITVKILVFDLRFDRCNFCYRNWDFDWIRTRYCTNSSGHDRARRYGKRRIKLWSELAILFGSGCYKDDLYTGWATIRDFDSWLKLQELKQCLIKPYGMCKFRIIFSRGKCDANIRSNYFKWWTI